MPDARSVLRVLLIGVMVPCAGTASAQEFPNKPLRIITGTAGGGSDFAARIVAQGIAGPLGQPVIVDNRVSLFADELGSKAPPDGYTLLVSGSSQWIRPFLQNVSYDVMRDFAPISLIVREALLIAIHPSVAANSVKELIALAKSRPGVLNYASAGTGGSAHLAGELFKSMAGINVLWVPYKGNAQVVTALVSGEVQITILDAGFLAPNVKSGKVKALAVASAAPSALAPGLPTVSASGLPGYEAGAMTGIVAPAKTPAAIVNRLNQEIVRVLNRPEVKERFLNAGAEVVANSPDQYASIIKTDMAKWGKVIRDAGIKTN